jgi:hypothetical protein
MLEPQERINDSEDYVVRRQCGCRVTFLGSCFHHTSRLDACAGHNGRDQFDERIQIVKSAKEELRIAKLMQPPL